MYAHDPLLPYYYIANIVVAIIAIISLFLSIRSSGKVSEELKLIKNSLAPYTEPLIKITDFRWLTETEELSCEKLPIGIMIYYKNVSNVPAEVYSSDLEVFYGLKKFDDVTEKVGVNNSQHILVPGEQLNVFTQQKELFQKYLAEPDRLFLEPTLIIELKVAFSKFGEKKKYIYHTKQKIFFDCKQPTLKIKQAIFDRIEEFADR